MYIKRARKCARAHTHTSGDILKIETKENKLSNKTGSEFMNDK